MYSFKMSFCTVPESLRMSAPLRRATATYKASRIEAVALMVIEVEIFVRSIPANRRSTSSTESIATPTFPLRTILQRPCYLRPTSQWFRARADTDIAYWTRPRLPCRRTAAWSRAALGTSWAECHVCKGTRPDNQRFARYPSRPVRQACRVAQLELWMRSSVL